MAAGRGNERTSERSASRVAHSCGSAVLLPRQLEEMVRLYDASASSSSDGPAGGGGGGKSKSMAQAYAYGKAILSIAKYPLEITSAEEAEELQGIGSFLAARIGRILSKHVAPAAASPSSSSVGIVRAASDITSTKPKTKKPRKAAEPPSPEAASTLAAAPVPAPILPILPSIFSPDTLRSASAVTSTRSPPPSRASSSLLPVCVYGELCFRKNPRHFIEELHPPSHAMAVSLTPMPSLKRTHEEIIVLSDDDDTPPPEPVVKRSKPSVPPAAAAAASSTYDDLDLMSDDDLVDLTSPSPPVTIVRSLSTPVAAASASLPPPHPAAAAAWSLPPAPAAAAGAGAKKLDKVYRPQVGSSVHALLLALAHSPTPLSKSQLLAAALAYYPPEKHGSDTSLWGGMSTLITRDLASKALTPIVYSLTPLGRSTAQLFVPKQPIASPLYSPDSFLSTPSPTPTAGIAPMRASSVASPFPAVSSSPPPSAAPVSLARRFCSAADFDVVLLVDVRERSGRKDAAYIVEKLGKQGFKCEARALAVGDFAWLARHKAHPTIEVVLDAMIERKRVGDLVSSIRDGRYHEQRSRLKKTHLQRLIYVIEGRVAEDTVHGLPLKTVESVLTSMNGVHGLLVHHTPEIESTISFLASLHQLLQGEVRQSGVPIILPEHVAFQPLAAPFATPNLAELLPSVPFALLGPGESLVSFSGRLHKSANLLHQELFGTQLRMIRGVSASLALNVIARYPAARALLDAYDQCANEEEEEAMLEDIARGPHQRAMGKAMSLKIRTFFRSQDYQ